MCSSMIWLLGGREREAGFFLQPKRDELTYAGGQEGAVQCRATDASESQCAVPPILLLPSLVNASTPPPSLMFAGFVSLIFAS